MDGRRCLDCCPFFPRSHQMKSGERPKQENKHCCPLEDSWQGHNWRCNWDFRLASLQTVLEFKQKPWGKPDIDRPKSPPIHFITSGTLPGVHLTANDNTLTKGGLLLTIPANPQEDVCPGRLSVKALASGCSAFSHHRSGCPPTTRVHRHRDQSLHKVV